MEFKYQLIILGSYNGTENERVKEDIEEREVNFKTSILSFFTEQLTAN